jgi:ribosomal protein S26
MTELIVYWYNIGDGPEVAKIKDLDCFAGDGGDVICLQECGDRVPMLKRWAKRHNWVLWLGRVPGSKSVPILYRKGIGVSRKRISRLAVPRMYVGAGAGPSVAKSKAVNGIKNKNLIILNTHMTTSATRVGKKYRFRRFHYRIHIRVLATMIRVRKLAGRKVLSVGDFNAEPRFPLLEPLRKMNMKQHVRPHTKGNRTIDLGWGTSNLEVVDVEVFNGSSDHHAVKATIKI